MKYDKRKNYKPCKILVIEMYFLFSHLCISALAYKIGYTRAQIDIVIGEWNANDGEIIVESKMNSYL